MDERYDDESEAEDVEDPAKRRLAPLFWLTTLIHLAAIASRFDAFAGALPPWVAGAVLWVHFPLFLLEGYFEGGIDYGPERAGMPLWMRIDSRPVKLSFSFGFTYLGVVVLQSWDLSIGPIDPNPPPEWALAQRALYFGMMSGGMFFANLLAATSVFIPLLRAITAPLRRLPRLVALPLVVVAGTGLGYAAVSLLISRGIGAQIKELDNAYEQQPALMIGVMLALLALPLVVGLLRGKSGRDEA